MAYDDPEYRAEVRQLENEFDEASAEALEMAEIADLRDHVWGIVSVLGARPCSWNCEGCNAEFWEAQERLHELYRLLGGDTAKLPFGSLPYSENTREAAKQAARLRGETWPDAEDEANNQ